MRANRLAGVGAFLRVALPIIALFPSLGWCQPDDDSHTRTVGPNSAGPGSGTPVGNSPPVSVWGNTPITNDNDVSEMMAPPPPPPASVRTEGTVYATASVYSKKKYSPNNLSPTANIQYNRNGCQDSVKDPIEISTGTATQDFVDFSVPGEMGLKFERIYNSSAVNPMVTTTHWKTNFDYMLDVLCAGLDRCVHVTLYRPDGSSLQFLGQPGRANADFTEQGGNGLATLHENADYSYVLHDEDGTTQTYSEIGQIQSITAPNGLSWIYTYSGTTTKITHTNGQSVTITDSAQGRTVIDPDGNSYSYQLNSLGDYTQATFPGTPATVYGYKYDNQNHLTEIDINGAPYNYTTYDTSGRANATYLADASHSDQTSIVYGSNATGLVATLTNPLGYAQTNQYDTQGHLVSISGAGVVTCGSTINGRTYDGNGYLAGTVDNNNNTHSYTFAANGQLQTETEAYGTSVARETDYVWDSNQQLNRLLSVKVVGWSLTTYHYNAQNRLDSVAVTNLSGNGNANQTLTTNYVYTLYSNGTVQTMTVKRPSPNGTDTDTSTFDTLGRLTTFTNGLGQTTTYSNYNGLGQARHVVGPNGDTVDYTYDARGRLVTTTSYPNGSAATWIYTYDGYGLPFTLTSPDGQVTTWNRDGRLWMSSITHNDKDGTSTQNFSYDANGDVLQRTVSRNGVNTLVDTAHYDALGRLYQNVGQHGQSLTYMYDGNGNVQSVTDSVGHKVVYQYDALNRVTLATESGGDNASVPSLTSPGSVPAGSFSVSWTSVPQATSYKLQEQVNGGAWGQVASGTSLSWSTSGRATGSYSYQVQACYSGGCGPFSAVSTTVVLNPPASAPTVTTPANNSNGAYTVSWSGVATANQYNLQEQVNGQSWVTVQSNGATTWGVSGKGNGTYGYRAQACNASGCGPWSATATTTVLFPPSSAPTVSVPATSANGSYTITWNAITGATSYIVSEQDNGGSWYTLASGVTATSLGVSGRGNGSYGHGVVACNASGCGPWSSAVYVTVLFPPPAPSSVTAPSYIHGVQYYVSWSASNTATSYNVIRNGVFYGSTSATSYTIPAPGTTDSIQWGAQACNASGCSATTNAPNITNTDPPGPIH